MINFTDFLERAAAGETRHDLFVVPNLGSRREAMHRLMDDASAVGLEYVLKVTGGTVTVNECAKARFIAVHRHAGQMLRGMEFTSALFDEFPQDREEAEALKQQVLAQVRA